MMQVCVQSGVYIPASGSCGKLLVMIMGALLFLLAIPASYAAAGRIQFVAGDARIMNQQQIERPATKGVLLEQGDTIVTGQNGSLQIVMADGGLIAVRPNTSMRIDTYQFSGKQDSSDKSFFSLAKGSFRSITGTIGKLNKQAYKVTTPDSSIGIRGTDHEPYVVLPPAKNAGTYDKVNSGAIVLKNNDGEVYVEPNRVGYASRKGGMPVILQETPAFYGAAQSGTAEPDALTDMAGSAVDSVRAGNATQPLSVPAAPAPNVAPIVTPAAAVPNYRTY